MAKGQWLMMMVQVFGGIGTGMGVGCMNENEIHGAPKKRREWRIALEGPH